MSGSNEPVGPKPSAGPTRGALVTVVATMGLLAALLWAMSPPRVHFQPAPLEPVPPGCPKVLREFVPSNVTEVGDPPLGGLTPEKRMRVLYRMNMEPCPCGCNLSVASCRNDHPRCEISRALAGKIIAEVEKQSTPGK